ncbi:MAG: hypothetical protein R3D67_22350 [Hyphomicrobiaceae bacterium]
MTFDDIPSSQPAGPHSQRSGGWGIVGAAIFSGILALAGLWYWVQVLAPERDEAAWRAADRARTIAAYDRYITVQPSGRHVGEARARRAALAQAATLAANAAPQPSAASTQGDATPASPPPANTPVSPPSPNAAAPPVADQPGQVAQASPVEVAANTTPAQPVAPQPTPATPPPNPTPAPQTAPPSPPPPATLVPRSNLPPALTDSAISQAAASAAPATWRLATAVFNGATTPGFTDQQTDFMTELGRLSASKLQLSPLSGAEALASTAARSEVSDKPGLIAWHSPALLWQRPEFAIYAGSVPFGLTPTEHVRWMRAEGARFLEEAYAALGKPVRAIPCGVAGGPGAWFRKEVRSPSDFNNLRVYGPPLLTQTLQKLGARPVSLASSSEVQGALSRLDAVFWVTPLTDIFVTRQRTLPVYHYPGIHNPAYMFDLLIGPATWNAMSEAQQQLVDQTCRRNLDKWATAFPATQNDALNRIRSQRTVVRPFTRPIREALQKAVNEVLSEESTKTPHIINVLQSYNRFRR